MIKELRRTFRTHEIMKANQRLGVRVTSQPQLQEVEVSARFLQPLFT